MGRRKRKNGPKFPLCSICSGSTAKSSVPILCCSSDSDFAQRTICNSCFYKYIFTTISHDITTQVTCPRQGCNAKVAMHIIQTALLSHNRADLWEQYTLKSGWRGTSEAWIKQFTLKCPGCRVPIEKNGGCNHMQCKRCQLSFNWDQAKNFYRYQTRFWCRRLLFSIKRLFFLCLILICIYCFMKFYSTFIKRS
jgi:hypothetical protein